LAKKGDVVVLMICENCGRKIFGFWKYGHSHICSMACLRRLIFEGKLTKIYPERGYPELGISEPKHKEKNG
jgi:hypothetical protein